jgi:phage/plasmid-like protein (TIGR03299 family)
MSQETLTWLNQNVLIGYADKRGEAWHYLASAQGDEPNHYDGPIPVADVERRLFHWEPVSRPVYAAVPCAADEATSMLPDGTPIRYVELSRQAILRSDNDAELGLFKPGYQIHKYPEWLLKNVSTILGDTLGIGSAGLLRNGAVAWVQIEAPETLSVEGIEHRPHLTAFTSCDGTLATGYIAGTQLVVCDNTLNAAVANASSKIKIKHTTNSLSTTRLESVREALGVIEQAADSFNEELKALVQQSVSDKQWADFLEAFVPLPEKPGRGLTLAEKKRDILTSLRKNDNRVSPWGKTAFGVLQAVNTYEAHEVTRKSGEDGLKGDALRAERNRYDAITGKVGDRDVNVLTTLNRVLSNA